MRLKAVVFGATTAVVFSGLVGYVLICGSLRSEPTPLPTASRDGAEMTLLRPTAAPA